MGGPNDWALPYWNYLGGVGGSQYVLPPSFAAQSLPDGSPNPLFVAMRYGPDGGGNIYLPTAASKAVHPRDTNFIQGEVNYDYLQNDVFTGSDSVTKPPGLVVQTRLFGMEAAPVATSNQIRTTTCMSMSAALSAGSKTAVPGA
jgi:hypothetical protein